MNGAVDTPLAFALGTSRLLPPCPIAAHSLFPPAHSVTSVAPGHFSGGLTSFPVLQALPCSFESQGFFVVVLLYFVLIHYFPKVISSFHHPFSEGLP